MSSAAPAHSVRIRAVAHGGAGVGRAQGPDADPRTWLVQGALPGELVEARLDHSARRHLRGTTLRVLEPSPVRVEPPCPYAKDCGGCGWQHVEPAAQGQLKHQIVADQLRDVLADSGVEIADGPGGSALGYRRRARMHYRIQGADMALGFYQWRSSEVVDVSRCIVLDAALDHAFQRVRELVGALPQRGDVLGISDGKVAVLGLVGVKPNAALERAAAGVLDEVLVGIALRGGRRRAGVGTTRLWIDAGGERVVATPFVFAQAHAQVNRELVRHVVAAASANGRRVLELFAGAGNFTLALARVAERVWTVEEDRDAVALSRQLAADAGLSINAKHGVVEKLLPRLALGQKHYDVVVLDPPRRGLGEAPSRELARIASKRIVYVSCDPATLARDLRVLIASGFSLEDVRVFDMMPMTPEVEVVATLVRQP